MLREREFESIIMGGGREWGVEITNLVYGKAKECYRLVVMSTETRYSFAGRYPSTTAYRV